MWDLQKSQLDALRFVSENRKVEIFYAKKIEACRGLRGDVLNLLQSECHWIRDRRPYYKVYPCMVDALCKLRLDAKFQCPEVPRSQISIRFALEKEPSTKDGIKIGSLFIVGVILRTPSGKESKGITIFANLLNPPNSDFENFIITFDPNPPYFQSVEDLLERGQDPKHVLRHDSSLTMRKDVQALAIRIALTTCMIADDPEIITPDILIADERQYEKASDEWKRKAEKRAIKKGKIGWNIGKSMETIPHFRRPHLRLLPTGPNRSVPKIVKVKSCMVHKNKLTTVPTGHMLEDGTEIEDGRVES